MGTKNVAALVGEMRAERRPAGKGLIVQLVIMSFPVALILALKPVGNLVLDLYMSFN
jgi:hypothetical protein